MKKTILLLTILTIGYGCKKQTASTTPQNTPQSTTSNRCQDSGICAVGYYKVMPVVNANTDTIVYQNNSTNLGHCKLVFVRYQQRYGYTNQPDSLLYRFIPIDFGINILKPNDTLTTDVFLRISDTYTNHYGLHTKTNKVIILNFDHY